MPNEYRHGEKLRVANLFDGSNSSGRGLIEGPKHGETYEVVVAVTSKKDASGIEKTRDLATERSHNIKIIPFDYLDFCQQHDLDPDSRDANLRYHDEMMKKLEPYKPHTVAMSGYFRILPQSFLDEYQDTKNVHPMAVHHVTRKPPKGTVRLLYDGILDVGDMDPVEVAKMVKLNKLQRAFKGESAPFDAMVFGYPHVTELRSTVHRAIKEYDEGAIEIQSAPIPIDLDQVRRWIRTRNWGAIFEYADELQGELKEKGDVPAFRTDIELTAERRLEHRTETG